MKTKAHKIARLLKRKFKTNKIDIAFVLGSGLSEQCFDLQNRSEISYEHVGMPKSQVDGHMAKFIFGQKNNKNILLLSRYHYYECASLPQIRLPYEVLKEMDCDLVVLTTSVGAVSDELDVGDVMCIKDHINFTGINPLVGIKPLEFVDSRNSYDQDLIKKMINNFGQSEVGLKSGVHMQFCGPTYESPAEVAFAKKCGADTVSMSTAHDIINCCSLFLKQISFACVTNRACQENDESMAHEDVLVAASNMKMKLKMLFDFLIENAE